MNRKDLYPTLDGYLSFKEYQEQIVFHALNSDYNPDWYENDNCDYSEWDKYPEQIWEEEEKFFDTKKSFQLSKKKRGFRNNKLWVKN